MATYPPKIDCVCVCLAAGKGGRGPAASPPCARSLAAARRSEQTRCGRSGGTRRGNAARVRGKIPLGVAARVAEPFLARGAFPQRQAASHQKRHPGKAEGCCAEKTALFTHALPGQSYRLAAATVTLHDKCPPGRVAGGEHPLLDGANWLQPSSSSLSRSPGGTSLEAPSPCVTRPPSPGRLLGFEVVPYQQGPRQERRRLAEPGGGSPTVPLPCHRDTQRKTSFQTPRTKAQAPACLGPPRCLTPSLPPAPPPRRATGPGRDVDICAPTIVPPPRTAGARAGSL